MAKKLGQRRKIMLTELSCKAEIAQFNDASFGDENIFRLHVSMNTLNINIKDGFRSVVPVRSTVLYPYPWFLKAYII